MFNFLDKIILRTIFDSKKIAPHPMLADPFEKPSSYRCWLFLLKYPLAMRYLKRKTETLAYFRLKTVFPIPQDEFLQQLKAVLFGQLTPSSTSTHPQIWTWAFRSIIIYPLMLISLITAAWLVKTHYQTQQLEQAISKHLVQYADLLHQNIAHRQLGKTEIVAKIDQLAQIERQKILSALPDYLRTKFHTALSTMTDDNKTVEDILAAFTAINQEFNDHRLPYYIVPKTFSANCLSFIDIPSELQWLLKIDPRHCKTTMLISYKIKQQERFRYQAETLPVYHGYRLDSVPISELALGVTYRNGLGSLVLLNSTRNYAINNILPALVYRGRHNIVPLWFKRNYQIVDEVANVYQKTLKTIYQGEHLLTLKNIAKVLARDQKYATRSRLRHSLMQVDKGLTGGNDWIHSGIDALSNVLKERDTNEQPVLDDLDLSAIEAIENLIIKSVAYHESYHQIPKSHWQEAAWVSTAIGDNELKNAILEEVGAYLVGLYYGEKTRAIQITQLFFFSVNILLKNGPEYSASRIILATLIDSYTNSHFTPRLANNPLEILAAYKTLNKLEDEELANLAEKAYIKLFERPFPEIEL